jgi:hypothetical protein
MAPTLFGHHSQVAAFASVNKHHSSLKWVCNTITSCSRYDNIRTLSAIRTTASRSLHLHAQSPLSIIGGAAAKIVANTDTVSTAAITTMILLALQYCAQPPLTRKFLDSKANKKGITMIEEIVKMGLSAIFFIRCGE